MTQSFLDYYYYCFIYWLNMYFFDKLVDFWDSNWTCITCCLGINHLCISTGFKFMFLLDHPLKFVVCRHVSPLLFLIINWGSEVIQHQPGSMTDFHIYCLLEKTLGIKGKYSLLHSWVLLCFPMVTIF